MIYAHKIQDGTGDYVDAENVRWNVLTASRIYGKKRDYWQEFESLEDALEYWGLTLIMPIEPETEPETKTEPENFNLTYNHGQERSQIIRE